MLTITAVSKVEIQRDFTKFNSLNLSKRLPNSGPHTTIMASLGFVRRSLTTSVERLEGLHRGILPQLASF